MFKTEELSNKFLEDKRNLIGLIFFAVGIIMFLMMLFNPLNYSFIHIDEWYSLSLIKMTFIDGLKLTAADVHPPLYYLIAKTVIKILTLLNIPFNQIHIAKIVSLVPYLILLLLSATKIKSKYGLLTASILVFAFGTMSEFFFKFITLRMYSWGFIFLLISFFYLNDVLEKSDKKSWALLTIFTILGAYTHYFIVISSMLIYLCLFLYLTFIKSYDTESETNKKIEIKKWAISVICIFIAYLPWIPIVIDQFNRPGNYWIPPIDLGNFINFITYFATNSKNDLLIILAIVLLIILFAISFIKIKESEKTEKIYLSIGLIASVFTFIFLISFCIFMHPILLPRYLIPLIGILWFVFSIAIGKIDNKYLLTAVIALIVVFGATGVIETHDLSNDFANMQVHDKELLNSMNTNDSVIIHTNGINVIMFNEYLNNTKQFSLSNIYGNQLHNSLKFKEKTPDDVKGIIDQNEGKKIYIIKNKGGKMPYLGENRTAEKIDEICISREVFIIKNK